MNRRVLSAFASVLLLLGTAAAQAATYYVRSDGNDSASGRSHLEAWATIAKVNNFNFQTGDRVLLHEGHRWEEQLRVDWSGTEELPVIISAYYVEDDGTSKWGYRTARPVIDGAGRLPTQGQYDALIRVQGDYVRIEKIKVTNSAGRLISFADVVHGDVVGCVVDGAYKSAINFLRSDYGRVLRTTVMHAGLVFVQDSGTWGGAIEFVDSDHGQIIDNTVAEVYGEGINANHGSTRTLIEGNTVFAARAVGIYADAAPQTTIRRNIVYGTSNPQFWRHTDTVGAGIALNNEKYHYEGHGGSMSTDAQSDNARIYGNIVAYTRAGLALWGALDESALSNTYVFNNTFVDNAVQITGLAVNAPGSLILNNSLVSISDGTRDVDSTRLNGAEARNNYFSQGNPGGDFGGSLDNLFSGLYMSRQDDWRSVSEVADINTADFATTFGAATIGAGDDTPLSLVTGWDEFNLDFNGNEFDAPMDIGALRYTDFTNRKPKSPTNVTVSR